MSEFNVWSGVTYLAATLGIVLGLMFIILDLMMSIPLLLAGIIAIPSVQNRVENYFEIELTRWVVVGIYCSLFAASIVIGTSVTETLY